MARRVTAISGALRHPCRDRPEPPAIWRCRAHRRQWI